MVKRESITWSRIRVPRNKKLSVRLIPFSIFWNNWKERNMRDFEGIETQDRLIVDRWARELSF